MAGRWGKSRHFRMSCLKRRSMECVFAGGPKPIQARNGELAGGDVNALRGALLAGHRWAVVSNRHFVCSSGPAHCRSSIPCARIGHMEWRIDRILLFISHFRIPCVHSRHTECGIANALKLAGAWNVELTPKRSPRSKWSRPVLTEHGTGGPAASPHPRRRHRRLRRFCGTFEKLGKSACVSRKAWYLAP